MIDKKTLAAVLKKREEMRRSNWGIFSQKWVDEVLFGPPWNTLPAPPIPKWITKGDK